MQHRDALDRADGQVEVRHRCGSVPRSAARTSASSVALAYGCAARYAATALFFPLVGGLGLAAFNQEFPAGPDVLLVQTLDDVRFDRAAQPECRGAFPGPLPGRFSGRGVVRHGPGATAAALPGGEVGDVVACVQGDVSRHDPLLSVPVPRSSFVMPVSDGFRSRREGKRGLRTFCGFAGARARVCARRPGLPGQGHESGSLRAEMTALPALAPATRPGPAGQRGCGVWGHWLLSPTD